MVGFYREKVVAVGEAVAIYSWQASTQREGGGGVCSCSNVLMVGFHTETVVVVGEAVAMYSWQAFTQREGGGGRCSCSNVLMTGGVLIGLHRGVYW